MRSLLVLFLVFVSFSSFASVKRTKKISYATFQTQMRDLAATLKKAQFCGFSVVPTFRGRRIVVQSEADAAVADVAADKDMLTSEMYSEDGSFTRQYQLTPDAVLTVVHSDDAYDRVTMKQSKNGRPHEVTCEIQY